MIEYLVLALVFLISSSLITGIHSAVQRIGKAQAEQIAKGQKGPAKFIFKKSKRDLLSYSFGLTKNIFLLFYALMACFAASLILVEPPFSHIIYAGLIILAIALTSDIFFRALSLWRPQTFFRMTCQIGSSLLTLLWPFSLFIFKSISHLAPPSKKMATFRIKDKILEILHDSEFAPYLDPNDQKLILSVVTFKERIAREIMVPRIDVFTLNDTTSVKEAAMAFLQEGYSRIPVWKENVDTIIGALYYKDLLNLYFQASESPEMLNKPIKDLLKPIVYAPETKKISQLLQVFLSKQIHLAIVVDEYGGTEGIVTIEDILEELVGDIADEYDLAEEALYTILPSGGWIVDAKMTILNIEEELGISIPQSPEYDTIGGFIFHKAGTIPLKGWRLHLDDFDLEILSSSERTVEKIRITPH